MNGPLIYNDLVHIKLSGKNKVAILIYLAKISPQNSRLSFKFQKTAILQWM